MRGECAKHGPLATTATRGIPKNLRSTGSPLDRDTTTLLPTNLRRPPAGVISLQAWLAFGPFGQLTFPLDFEYVASPHE